MNLTIQWRTKATPEIPKIKKAEPPGQWTLYKEMSEHQAALFFNDFNQIEPHRSMFEYRSKPTNPNETKTQPN